MPTVSVPQPLAAIRVSNEERPKALGAEILVQGQHGDEVRYVRIQGQLDLKRVTELLKEMPD